MVYHIRFVPTNGRLRSPWFAIVRVVCAERWVSRMSRAIDDEPTIEQDWNEIMVICDNCGHAVHAKRENCKVSAQPEPQWISCSDRLPEESGRYLVTRGLNACGSLWNRIYIANYSDLMGIRSEKIWWQGNVGKSDFKRLDDVLAWMPLQEPYAERRTDEYCS